MSMYPDASGGDAGTPASVPLVIGTPMSQSGQGQDEISQPLPGQPQTPVPQPQPIPQPAPALPVVVNASAHGRETAANDAATAPASTKRVAAAQDRALFKEKMQDHDDFRQEQFQAVNQNAYGAAILAFMFVRHGDVGFYCLVPLALSWLIQIGFITYLSGAYLDDPVLSKESLEGTAVIPQLLSVAYFILTMLSNLEWLFTSAYICLFSTKYKRGDSLFDLRTKSLVVFKSKTEIELIQTPNSVSGDYLWLFRTAAFILCTLSEIFIWLAVLLVGVQYIMWSGTQGETPSEQAASILWATLYWQWITTIDEKVCAHGLPSKYKKTMQEVEFQVKHFEVSELGSDVGAVEDFLPTKTVPPFKSISNAARFVLPSCLIAGAAVGAVYAQRNGVIIEWPALA